MPSTEKRVVILGSGGTIAGVAADPTEHTRYVAGQLGVAELINAVPPLAAMAIEAEQVAQLDSSAMTVTVWQALARRAAFHLARDEVAGVVITHGTDTLEETAWFLQRVLAPRKPLVLTAAMRPATALSADGPQNLLDAVRVARAGQGRGVLLVFASRVHGAHGVQKMHSYRVDAFDSPDAGALAHLEEGVLHLLRPWPEGEPLGLERITREPTRWPWVEIVTSHAGARPDAVSALVRAGVQGLVIAGSGGGSVHDALKPTLAQASVAGVVIALATRCAAGAVHAPRPEAWRVYPGLNAVKSRVELTLELLAAN